MVYTHETCPRCKVLKKKLELSGLEFEECMDIDKMLAMGMKSSPMMEVDGQLLTFEEAIKYVNER